MTFLLKTFLLKTNRKSKREILVAKKFLKNMKDFMRKILSKKVCGDCAGALRWRGVGVLAGIST